MTAVTVVFVLTIMIAMTAMTATAPHAHSRTHTSFSEKQEIHKKSC
jgi:hypothetical protein